MSNPHIMKYKILLTAVIFPFVGAIFSGCSSIFPAEVKTVSFQTDVGKYAYQVEVSDTKEERELGLMHRESLDEDKGMLFIFEDERRVAFWMKNTLISLDMIFMDKNFKVVDFFENVPTCEKEPCPRYIPNNPAMYVVELNAGQIDKMELDRGDLIELN